MPEREPIPIEVVVNPNDLNALELYSKHQSELGELASRSFSWTGADSDLKYSIADMADTLGGRVYASLNSPSGPRDTTAVLLNSTERRVLAKARAHFETANTKQAAAPHSAARRILQAHTLYSLPSYLEQRPPSARRKLAITGDFLMYMISSGN